MKIKLLNNWVLLVFLLLVGTANICAQQKQKFSVLSFEMDQFDLTARNQKYKKVDGNGSLYAIIKVTSNKSNDDLKAYNFNFGNMNSLVEQHDDELWVYVQRNAKIVTISRKGYATISKYDLQTTIEAGRTYLMQLSVVPTKIRTQMVLFTIEPADCRAMVTVKASTKDAVEDVVGLTDETGATAKSLPYNNYTYKVVAEGYYPTNGQFMLNDMTKTHEEKVILKPRFAMITLHVDADAEIYVNGEMKGRRSWTGRLNSGNHQVECRQANHQPSSMTISVTENESKTHELPLPSPITGILSIVSQPLGAEITIDNEPKGKTPQQITQLLIGHHTIALSKDGYENISQAFDILENQTTSLNIEMKKETKGSVLPKPVVKEKPIVTPSNALNKSFKYNYKGVTFKCKAKRGYVTITGFDVDAKDVTIPAKVEYEGQYYPVKEIDTFINGNNYGATTVVIEEGVEIIANYAFNEFRKLTEATIPRSIKKIGKNAFRDRTKINK